MTQTYFLLLIMSLRVLSDPHKFRRLYTGCIPPPDFSIFLNFHTGNRSIIRSLWGCRTDDWFYVPKTFRASRQNFIILLIFLRFCPRFASKLTWRHFDSSTQTHTDFRAVYSVHIRSGETFPHLLNDEMYCTHLKCILTGAAVQTHWFWPKLSIQMQFCCLSTYNPYNPIW